MILGNLCTRGCGFCSVPKGSPHKTAIYARSRRAGQRRAHGRRACSLRYVVITSVNRDDLPDGGSHPFCRNRSRGSPSASRHPHRSADARFLRRPGRRRSRAGCRARCFQSQHGDRRAPVPRASGRKPTTRQSLEVLRFAEKLSLRTSLTKSGFMVGLGEEPGEVEQLLRDLRAVERGRRDHRPVSAAHPPQLGR